MAAVPMAIGGVDVLRVVELDDLEQTARLHLNELPGGFFVSLGPRFLRAYHRTFVTSPAGVALLAESEGQIVGFVLGTVDEGTHYRHVVNRDRWALVLRGTLALAVRPSQALRFIKTRLYRYVRGMVRLSRSSSTDQGGEVSDSPTGVLSHMAVDSGRRRNGIGSLLLGAFTQTARAQGSETLRLSTASDNDAALRFYDQQGWVRGKESTDADGRRWRQFCCPAC